MLKNVFEWFQLGQLIFMAVTIVGIVVFAFAIPCLAKMSAPEKPWRILLKRAFVDNRTLLIAVLAAMLVVLTAMTIRNSVTTGKSENRLGLGNTPAPTMQAPK